jgi:hypothetical protein
MSEVHFVRVARASMVARRRGKAFSDGETQKEGAFVPLQSDEGTATAW